MKNIGKILLGIYVVLVTAACAVFGTLYFLGVESPLGANALTYAEAKILVNRVYDAQIGNGGVSTLALEYQDYPSDSFPTEIENNPLFRTVYDLGLTTMKELFDVNAKTDIWLDIGTNSHGDTLGFVKYYIQGNTVNIHSIAYEDEEYYGIERYIPNYVFKITKTSETGWRVDFYQIYHSYVYEAGLSDMTFSFWHYTFESENEEIYNMEMKMLCTKYISLPNEITAENVVYVTIYDFNLKTHKAYGISSYEEFTGESPFGINVQKLTDSEELSYARDIFNNSKSVMGGYLPENTFENAEKVTL